MARESIYRTRLRRMRSANGHRRLPGGEEPEGFDQFDFNACAGRLLAMVVTGEESDKVASLQVLQALCHSEGQDGSEDQDGEDGSEGGDDEDGDGDVDETFVVTTMVQTGLRDASPVVRAAALEALSTLPTTEREMVSHPMRT